MSVKYIVRSGALQGFPELVESFGQDPLAILDAEGIAPGVLRTPDAYISYLALTRALNRAAQICERPDFGALLALRQGLDVTGALCAQLCLQPTMARALELIQHHLDFHARGVHITVQRTDAALVLSMDFAFRRQVDCSQIGPLSMGLLVRSLNELHGSPLAPLSVELRQAAPPAGDGYARLFAVPVQFGSAADRVTYAAGLDAAPVSVDAALRARLDDHWRRDHLTRQPLSLSQQTERVIVSLLPSGDCSLTSAARILELHPRVLQQQLRREGCTFGSILRDARRQLACEHLAHSDVPLTRLAMNLGFGDLAVFSRSFRRWTGQSPSQWRRAAGS